jgi:N-acetylmuramoyl-L-alanine amidase
MCQGISGFMPTPATQFRTVTLLLTILLLAFQWVAADPTVDSTPIVVLDPGHGGKDLGAKGPTSGVEKEICLAVARALARQLETTHQVILTRSDDYDVDLRNRTAVANHHQADLFISLHCGAGFLHTATGMAVYAYKPALAYDTTAIGQGSPNPNRWDQSQLPHLASSRQLAMQMQKTLKNIMGIEKVWLRQVPLLVLQGATMPAIVIEIGHITHPATEKNLLSPQWQQQLAKAIGVAIEQYEATDREQP